MTLAAIDWLSISINLLLVVFVIVCLLMTLLILMQRPKQEGLGAAFGGGVTDQVFGARTTNVLQRGTVYLGSLFFILSLTLAVLIGQKNKKTTLVAPKPKIEAKENAKEQVPAVPLPAPTNAAGNASTEPQTIPAESNVPAEPVAPADASAPVAPSAPLEQAPPVNKEVESSEKSGQP